MRKPLVKTLGVLAILIVYFCLLPYLGRFNHSAYYDDYEPVVFVFVPIAAVIVGLVFIWKNTGDNRRR
jgi:hypothetical protein